MDELNPRLWLIPEPVFPSKELVALAGSQLAAEILIRRGIKDLQLAASFLSPGAYTPSPPSDLPGMEKAVERILRAVQCGEEVCVWGDFDVDGQTSTTILVSTLRYLGAKVRHYIPVRARESHGIHLASLERLAVDGVRLLITCDTGISAYREVAWANANRVDVVITDHHELPETLPEAEAIVNPRMLLVEHPLYPLPGCGVAYKLAEELLARSNASSFTPSLLDLAALGIVADAAELRGECRYLLQRGLAALRSTRRVGLHRLFETANVDPTLISEETISFAIAPRMNALGRLDDANGIVDLLTTKSNSDAKYFADHLEKLNLKRGFECSRVFQEAIALTERRPELLKYAALVLEGSDWNAGVVGIVASRLVERFHRPAILFSVSMDGIARGSARSLEGVNITHAIAGLKDMLTGFGGHPMAAGLSLPADIIPDFRQALSYIVLQQMGSGREVPPLKLDANIPLAQADLTMAEQLELLSPFGIGNPAPVFFSEGNTVVKSTPIGNGHEHLSIQVADQQGNKHDVLFWNGEGMPRPKEGDAIDLAYTLRASTYQGERQLQLEWVDYRITNDLIELISEPAEQRLEDQRNSDPTAARVVSQSLPNAVIWSEASAIPGMDRTQLHPAEILVIAFPPPGPEEIRAALKMVSPDRVLLLPITLPNDSPKQFMHSLMLILRTYLNPGSPAIGLDQLAAWLGHRARTVELGLNYLQANGKLAIGKDTKGKFLFSHPTTPDINMAQRPMIEANLGIALDETSAFRTSFASASREQLYRDYFND